MSRIKEERIITFWRFGYIDLLGYEEDYEYISEKNGTDWEWKRIFWKFYYRVGLDC